MKSSVVVKAMPICQGFQFSSDLDLGNAFIQSGISIASLFNKL